LIRGIAFQAYRAAGLFPTLGQGGLHGLAQSRAEGLVGQLMDGQTRRPFRQFQIRVDVAGQTQDVSFGVEQGRRRGVAPQQQGFGQAFGVRDVGYGSPPGQIKVAPGHSGEPGGQVGRQGGWGGFTAEKTPFLVDDLEQAGMGADGFGRAEQQKSARPQGVGKDREDLGLEFRGEIDEKIAADDAIHAQKGRIAQQIVAGEHDVFAQARQNRTGGRIAPEMGVQAFGPDLPGHAGAIDALAGRFQGIRIDVRGEDFERPGHCGGSRVFGQQHGHGIGFLAGGAAGHPDPDIFRGPQGEHAGQGSGQGLEGRGVPEKRRDAD